MNNLNASNFKHTNEFQHAEFEKILLGIYYSYCVMIKKEKQIPNDENKISRILLSTQYLKNRKFKSKLKLDSYRFEREVPENESEKRPDIRVITLNDFEHDNLYFSLECKRLDNRNPTGTTGLNGKYVREGMMRFITGGYSTPYGRNGMIGFIVEKMNISNNICNINTILANLQQENLQSIKFIRNFKYSYISNHISKKKPIILYHLMFDFSKRIN